MLDKLIGLTTIGSTLAGLTMLQRFLAGVTGVLALTVVSALMSGLILMGGFITAYFTLVHYGVEPMLAALTVTSATCMVTALLIIFTLIKVRRLKEMSQHHLYRDVPSLAHIGDIASAFIKGLKASPVTRRD